MQSCRRNSNRHPPFNVTLCAAIGDYKSDVRDIVVHFVAMHATQYWRASRIGPITSL